MMGTELSYLALITGHDVNRWRCFLPGFGGIDVTPRLSRIEARDNPPSAPVQLSWRREVAFGPRYAFETCSDSIQFTDSESRREDMIYMQEARTGITTSPQFSAFATSIVDKRSRSFATDYFLLSYLK